VNIFVSSQSGNALKDPILVAQMAQIKFEARKTVPVIVVDDRYSLAEITCELGKPEHTYFRLDDFLHDKGSNADGMMVVNENLIPTLLSGITTEWVVIEFGHNNQSTCLEFISKLARHSYMTPVLRTRNIVFSVPGMYLGFMARTINETFNNLPISKFTVAQSGKVGLLFMSSHLEKVFISMPLLTAPLARLNRALMFVYQRL
jgi:hypothetical protein